MRNNSLCVTLGELLKNHSVPQFPHLKNANDIYED
jgi:hypothetical protein